MSVSVSKTAFWLGESSYHLKCPLNAEKTLHSFTHNACLNLIDFNGGHCSLVLYNV